MRSFFMRSVLTVVFMMFVFASLAVAQVPASGNVFIGYSYENSSSSSLDLDLSRPNLQGWEASLEGKVFPHLGIVADFGGHYGSESFTVPTPAGPQNVKVTGHELEVMFGPRVAIPIGKITPFGEIMGGVAHMNTGGTVSGPSSTGFASALGGGIDYRLIRVVAWRFEGDYVHTHFFSTGQSNLRLSTGIVFRF